MHGISLHFYGRQSSVGGLIDKQIKAMIRIVSPWFMRNIVAMFSKDKDAYSAISLFVLIIFIDRKFITPEIVNHEKIHFWQQVELIFVFFYLLYGLFYLYNRIRLKEHDASYRGIPFEKEAYANEDDLYYLKNRKLWAWTKHV
jgi:hypothetical protein